jgi:trans-2,3-dihydro-3-hydroxyanthranilate isomerase
MDQPVPSVEPYGGDAAALLRALGVEGSQLPIELYDNGFPHLFVALSGPGQVAALAPDRAYLETLGVLGVNCFAGSGSRWKTRMFSPGSGFAEDPATGSAAGPLALHVCRHGLVPFGTEIEISQGDELARPSRLFARADGSTEAVERIEVSGAAVVVARGEFRLP